MNKLPVNTIILFFLISLSFISKASLITNLTQVQLDARDYSKAQDHLSADLLGVNYISYKGYDWAWVSPVNIESSGMNTLYAPELQKNWLFADNTLLNILKTELTLADFTNDKGNFIQSTEFFNSYYSHVDANDFNSDFVSSELTAPNTFMGSFLSGRETFYVRELAADPAPKPIPEPTTLVIFALGIMVLISKKRLFN